MREVTRRGVLFIQFVYTKCRYKKQRNAKALLLFADYTPSFSVGLVLDSFFNSGCKLGFFHGVKRLKMVGIGAVWLDLAEQ